MTRVLVVEDEESYSDALAYMLRKEGFEVAIAADGNAALTEFDRNGADIVLLAHKDQQQAVVRQVLDRIVEFDARR